MRVEGTRLSQRQKMATLTAGKRTPAYHKGSLRPMHTMNLCVRVCVTVSAAEEWSELLQLKKYSERVSIRSLCL